MVAIIGARQVGKTTVAREVARAAKTRVHVFDLENPNDLARLALPMDALRDLEGLVVIDEIHRRPDLFPTLRVLADRRPLRSRFLVLGSASVDLLKQTSESLAGRVAYVDMTGFTLDEVGPRTMRRLWTRGAFPRSFLARGDAESMRWRINFGRTFLERDVRSYGIAIEPAALLRFWRMLAHYHGQVWNASEFARAFAVSDATVRRYLDALCGLLVVRRLNPWFENVGKRQVKAPKVYLADSGMMHAFLDIADADGLRSHPRIGASWEGFALGELVHHLGVRWDDCYFWAVHTGAELDLFVQHGRRRLGFEFKHTGSPELTRSMLSALDVLRLHELVVIHTGEHVFPLHPRVRAVPLARLHKEIRPIGRH